MINPLKTQANTTIRNGSICASKVQINDSMNTPISTQFPFVISSQDEDLAFKNEAKQLSDNVSGYSNELQDLTLTQMSLPSLSQELVFASEESKKVDKDPF
jgi:hypothetical protein